MTWQNLKVLLVRCDDLNDIRSKVRMLKVVMQIRSDDVSDGLSSLCSKMTKSKWDEVEEGPVATGQLRLAPPWMSTLMTCNISSCHWARVNCPTRQACNLGSGSWPWPGDSPDPRVSDNLFNYTLFMNRNNKFIEMRFVHKMNLIKQWQD